MVAPFGGSFAYNAGVSRRKNRMVPALVTTAISIAAATGLVLFGVNEQAEAIWKLGLIVGFFAFVGLLAVLSDVIGQ